MAMMANIRSHGEWMLRHFSWLHSFASNAAWRFIWSTRRLFPHSPHILLPLPLPAVAFAAHCAYVACAASIKLSWVLGSLTFALLQTEGNRVCARKEEGVWENKREYVVQVPWQALSLGVTIARSVYLLCVV